MKFIYLNCARNEINVKKILAVINATYAVAKTNPEKSGLPGFEPGSNCEDLLYIYFIPQFKYMNFIYS